MIWTTPWLILCNLFSGLPAIALRGLLDATETLSSVAEFTSRDLPSVLTALMA